MASPGTHAAAPHVLLPQQISPLALAARDPAARVQRLAGCTMGTTWSVLLGAPAQPERLYALAQGIQACLDEVVAQMSAWAEDSDLARFNRAGAQSWQALPEGFFTVLDHALEVARASAGAYDPTAGALVDLWGFGPAPRRTVPPMPAEIEAARAQVGWQRIALDAHARRAFQPGGVRLDLSGIAKGYGVDRVSDYLTSMGVVHHLVEVGGELRGQGVKPDGQPWWVALEAPLPAAGGLAASAGLSEYLVALHGLAVATSGDYRRYFEADGQRYAHTIDPRSGMPVCNGLASVTVLHPTCMAADAAATALTVLGVEAGMAYARRHGLAALFVRRMAEGFEEIRSPALAAMLE